MIRIGTYGFSDNLGGTEIYLITLADVLKDSVCFDYIVAHDCGEIPFEQRILDMGGRVYREYYTHSERNKSDYILPAEIIKRHPEWKGIYINLQRVHTAYALLVEAKKADIPLRMIHAHVNNYMYSVGIKDKLYEVYFKLTRKNVITHYLACSNLAGEWMFGKNTEVLVIPNAVNFEKFKMNYDIRKKKRKEYGILDEEIVIGFCGRLVYQKNPELLIDILNKLQYSGNFKLLIVGDGELKESMISKAYDYGIGDRVIYAGLVEATEEYYQMMDCFVLPSRFEGFGIVLLEAQAAGLKCFTTDKVVPYETNVTGRVTFISEKASAAEWAKTIVDGGFERKDCLLEMKNSDYSIESMRHKMMTVFRNEREH